VSKNEGTLLDQEKKEQMCTLKIGIGCKT